MLKKSILAVFILLTVLGNGMAVQAETITKKLTVQMVIEFSTQRFYIANDTDFEIALSYKVYPQLNPANQLIETVRMPNWSSISQVSKPLAVQVPFEGILYKGSFTFNYTYDSKTGNLSVNGSPIAMNTKTLINANVYPEAWLDPQIVSVGMNPLPFSQVKAVVGGGDYVKIFNERINNNIDSMIILQTNKYGTNIQTNTKLAVYINLWQRNADGTYDKTKAQTQLQVIFTAADFINGRASGDG
jgi:hypothetical protein